MQGYIGVITCFAGDFIPKYWLPCNGQQLRITANPAVYAILGNVFGGDGQTYFNLPDLRGRTPVSPGTNGINPYTPGMMAGAETVILTANNLPTHTHDGTKAQAGMQASTADGIDPNPPGGFPSRWTGAFSSTSNCTMAKGTSFPSVETVGTGLPVPILSPYLVINYMICMSGIFPSRN